MKKVKYSNLLILGIIIYLIFNGITTIISKNIKTEVLKNEKTQMKIKRECLVIRDEYLLKSDTNGTLDLLAEEGQKVTKSQEIASVFHDLDKTIDDDINKLNEEISKLKTGESSISKNEINEFNLKIDKDINEIQKNLLEKDYSKTSEHKNDLQNNVEDKNKLLNNGVDAIKLSTKEEQKSILENKRKNSVQTYLSSISGIVSYKYDGQEEKYNFDDLQNVTVSDIKSAKNSYTEVTQNTNKIKEGDVILRIINNYDTYIATYMDKEEIKNLEINQSVRLVNDKENIEAKVYDIYEEKDNFIAIFKINNQNIGIYDTRVTEFDIIYKQMEGLKIPKSSIKTVEDKKGVYVVNEEINTPTFVELKGIEYEDNDFVYINYNKNHIEGTDTVDLYDKIILKPNFINTKMKVE